MEGTGDWDQKNLIHELTQGRELAQQLQIHLNAPASSHEAQEFLLQKILHSYDKSLAMLKWTSPAGDSSVSGCGLSESPGSLTGSPGSEDSDREFKDQEPRSDGSRKRKALPRWTQQVQVCPGTGLEGPLDDGYSWRKYGQKDILGAKYPRGYYRCTHRHVRGCLATKQVQRSNEDPTIFEITYRGRHTCAQASNVIQPLIMPSPEKQLEAIEAQSQDHQQPRLMNEPQPQEILLSFKTGLKVITEDLDSHHHHHQQQQQTVPSFCFPSTSDINVEHNNAFSTNAMLDSSFMRGFSTPEFVSPATSGSNYFSLSPNRVSGLCGPGQNVQASESDLTEIISAATSATNSPTVGVGLEFPFGNMEFDSNFTFDNPGFFS